jgi:hypothetical protein
MSCRRATERTLRPLADFGDALGELDLTLETSIAGYGFLADQNEYFTNERWREMIQRSGEDALNFFHFDLAMEHAGEQARRGFPILYAQAVIGLTSALETAVRDFTHAWIRDHDAALSTDAVSQLTIPFAQFTRLKRSDRAAFLLDQLELRLRSSGSGQRARPGVEPHLRLLAAVGVSFVPAPDVTAAINELVAVRNQLIHHAGRVNGRFLELCPHFASKRQKKIQVNHTMWMKYYRGASDFVEGVEQAAITQAAIEV